HAYERTNPGDPEHRSGHAGDAGRYAGALRRLAGPGRGGDEGDLRPAAAAGHDPGLRRRLRHAGRGLRLRGLRHPAVEAGASRSAAGGRALMARARGQVDEAKTEAILDAAVTLFQEKGALASMEAIARRAGVSRQTLYNRFPSKVDIGRALAARRSDAVTGPLRSGGEPETVLTAMASALLEKICTPKAGGSMRGVALMSPEVPELAAAIYEAGPAEGLRRLAAWLGEQDRAGRLAV